MRDARPPRVHRHDRVGVMGLPEQVVDGDCRGERLFSYFLIFVFVFCFTFMLCVFCFVGAITATGSYLFVVLIFVFCSVCFFVFLCHR